MSPSFFAVGEYQSGVAPMATNMKSPDHQDSFGDSVLVFHANLQGGQLKQGGLLRFAPRILLHCLKDLRCYGFSIRGSGGPPIQLLKRPLS